MPLIIEELKNYNDLEYLDEGRSYVKVYHNSDYVGNATVFTDTEAEDDKGNIVHREYVAINNEVIYLKNIQQKINTDAE